MSDDKKDYPLPKLGEQVHYTDPKITGRVGWNSGMRGRGNGPYLALVVNEIVGEQKVDLAIMMPQAGGGVLFVVDVVGPDMTRKDDAAYWEFASPDAKARAAKRLKEAVEAKVAAELG